MHKMAFAHVFGPEKKNGFGPFSYKFFVCIRVGLSEKNPVLPGSNSRPNVSEGYEARKIPFTGIELTSQRVRRLRG